MAAAIHVLGHRPEASMAEIAAEAGVTRQTAYVHFGTREALLAAVRDELSRRAVTVLDAADLRSGPATEALCRFLAAVGTLLVEQSALDHAGDEGADASLHLPIEERLRGLIRRGRDSAEFTTDLETEWLIAATVALGHAADHQIRVGRLDAQAASTQLRSTVIRLYGAKDPGRLP